MRSPWKISQILFPAEHGSWGWLLVPSIAGVIAAGKLNIPVLVLLISGLSAFLLRQPVVTLLRIALRRGNPQCRIIALRTTLVLLSVCIASLGSLLLYGRLQLFWLVCLFVPAFALYLYANLQGRKTLRSWWNEALAAVVLAAMAPAVIVAADGTITPRQALIGLFMAMLNFLGALYVRMRISDTHRLPARRMSVPALHGIALLISIVCASLFPISLTLLVIPWSLLFLRALWFCRRPSPLVNIKVFGFIELGVEMSCAIWIALLLRH